MAVEVVSADIGVTGLYLALALTLGMAAVIAMVHPYSQPQLNDVQCLCFVSLSDAKTRDAGLFLDHILTGHLWVSDTHKRSMSREVRANSSKNHPPSLTWLRQCMAVHCFTILYQVRQAWPCPLLASTMACPGSRAWALERPSCFCRCRPGLR